LRAGRAAVVGMRLFYSFHRSVNGQIQMPRADESQCGWHAVLLVGYDDDAERFIFKNSWGETWGRDGYGFLPYSYIVEHALAAHVFSNEELG
jgi:C1A family cysteine protease